VKIDVLLHERAEELRRAYRNPAPQSPPVRTRGFHIGVAVAAALAVVLLAVPIAAFRSGADGVPGPPGSGTPGLPLETTVPPSTEPDPVVPISDSEVAPEPHDLNVPLSGEGFDIEDAAATPARILRTRSFGTTTFRLSERSREGARCLEVTALVNDVVHSRGGTCGLRGNPSSIAWDIESPIRFTIDDTDLVAFFGRAGSDVATVRVSGPVNVADTQVSGAWLAVAKVSGELPEIVVTSYASDDTKLFSEAVPMEPIHTGGPLPSATVLDAVGLLAELQIAGATVDQPSTTSTGSPFSLGEPVQACVNGDPLLMFEFHEEARRKWESADITRDGRLTGPGQIVTPDWEGTPRFFAAGRLIVLYLNEDPTTIALLTDILGPTRSPDAVGNSGTVYLSCEN